MFKLDLHIYALIYMQREGSTTYSLCYVLLAHCIEAKFIKNNKLYTVTLNWVYFYL